MAEKRLYHLGVFNRYEKITDDMIDAWREILQAHGLDSDCIQLESASSDYMERYLDVDIALDTYPYPGGGTTFDALCLS